MGIIDDFKGIGSGLAGYAAAAAVIHEVFTELNTARTCALLVSNQTDLTMRLSAHHHAWGGFSTIPDQSIPPRAASLFGSQSRGGSLFTGTEGQAVYELSEGTQGVVRWNNPFVGKNECSAAVTGTSSGAFMESQICGAGNDCEMFFEFTQVVDPRLVKGDYRWVRLEGYVLTGARDPDDFSPAAPGLLPLFSYWSAVRKDNFATADPALTRQERLAPDYVRFRLDGEVMHPDAARPSGTVPLQSWWSAERQDNWTTSDPAYADRPRTIGPDYRPYRVEGFVFDPRGDQPDNTLPLHSWYSRVRADNFLTSDPAWVPDL